jgi:hypothetical protein
MLVCVLGVAYGAACGREVSRVSEIDVNLCNCSAEDRAKHIAVREAEPEEYRFQWAKNEWQSYCRCNKSRPFNHTDLRPTEIKLRGEVDGDSAAGEALEFFLECDYWQFVNCCTGNFDSMREINRQKFREVLILLAPVLVSTRYMAKAVRLVGLDQREVRAVDMQHVPFCLDMFFYGAVRNGQLGRYALAKVCMEAFYYPCLKWGRDGCEDERFKAYNISRATFGGMCFDGWPTMYYYLKSIWPNWK